MAEFRKYSGSKYKYVQYSQSSSSQKRCWFFRIGNSGSVYYETEKEAAIAADKYLISKGREPVNILKRK